MLSLSHLSIHFDPLALATSYLEIAGLCIYSVNIYQQQLFDKQLQLDVLPNVQPQW